MISSASLSCAKLAGKSATDFIAALPRGAYTTARVLQGTTRVFELQHHIERLTHSIQPFLKEQNIVSGGLSLPLSILSAVSSTLDSSTELLSTSNGKLTILLLALNDQVEVHTHLEAMKPRTAKRIRVALAPTSRTNATVKDSKWIQDRESVVDQTAEDTLLIKDGCILEGSQTNFFAVNAAGTLVTAQEGILLGTVRSVVLDACKALGIPVKLAAPSLGEDFAEAFLASTSRLVLPIDEIGSISLPEERPVSLRIAAWVEKHVDERSVGVRELLRHPTFF